jgi:hypothetical protein
VTKSPILKYWGPEITAGVIMEIPPAGFVLSYEVVPWTVLEGFLPDSVKVLVTAIVLPEEIID